MAVRRRAGVTARVSGVRDTAWMTTCVVRRPRRMTRLHRMSSPSSSTRRRRTRRGARVVLSSAFGEPRAVAPASSWRPTITAFHAQVGGVVAQNAQTSGFHTIWNAPVVVPSTWRGGNIMPFIITDGEDDVGNNDPTLYDKSSRPRTGPRSSTRRSRRR